MPARWWRLVRGFVRQQCRLCPACGSHRVRRTGCPVCFGRPLDGPRCGDPRPADPTAVWVRFLRSEGIKGP